MAKITRKKLARGTKLMPGHVSTPLTDAATQLTDIDISREQMKRPMAPFCVNLSLPYLSSDSRPAGTMAIPFALPPTQDFFATSLTPPGGKDASYDADLPQIKLKSVSFSFDQRGEPAAIASNFWTQSGTDTDTGTYGYSDQQGKLTYDDVTKLDIKLSLHEKMQMFFGDTYPYPLEKSLWTTVIPSPLLAHRALRHNPFLQPDLDITINPYNTLLFTVSCPGLEDSAGRYLTLPSIEVSLKFVCELMPRDSGSTSVQNIPVDGGSGEDKYGAKTAPSVTISPPSVSTALEADSSDGVNYNITTIDNEFRDKLQGGYDYYADTPPTEVIKDDAAYEVIAVPLYQNSAHGGISANETYLTTYPYTGTTASPKTNGLFDRRFIPLHHSYTIHHAILAWNWTPWAVLNATDYPIDSGAVPAFAQLAYVAALTQELQLQVGVGLGTGARGDNFDYEELASLDISNPNNYDSTAETPPWTTPDTTGAWDTGLIDRLTSTTDPPSTFLWKGSDPAARRKWNWELHSIPLVGTSSGAGYYTQGKPIFVGPGWTTTQDRTAIGTSGAPDTIGAEQWLEVRALLKPTGGTSLPLCPYQFGGGGIGDTPSILVGYGGCYVYLICKKHLTR